MDSNKLRGLQHLRTLNLRSNYLSSVSSETFSALISLRTLDLGHNYMTEIHGNMWVGLQALNSLSLNHNYLTEIPRHGLSHLHGLRTFDLSFNRLTTLRADIFNSDDFPESNGRPARLDLKLNGNGFVCNTTMCWLIEGIRSGTIGSFSGASATCANGGSSLFSTEINCISGKKYFLFPKTTSEMYAIQWRIQDFPEEGLPTLQGAPTYDFAKISQKLHEIERIWTPGGASKILLCSSPLPLLFYIRVTF